MGTLHLKRLGELISAAIARYDLEPGVPKALLEESSDEQNS
jgi:hypothetical protein